jgi:hypothetical protein
VVRLTGKRVLTPGKITFGNLIAMSDLEWASLREPWQRLRWARRYWQTQTGSATTAKAAAESLGMQENTYSAYEREPSSSKHTAIDHQRAVQFGRKFKVNWVWILTGEETPFSRTPAQTRAVEMLSTVAEKDQEEVLDMIELLVKRRTAS